MIVAAPSFQRKNIASLRTRGRRPTPWIVDRVAARGRLTTLVGMTGAGKSWFALMAAHAVLTGGPVGGILAEQGTPLYVDGEMCEDDSDDRCLAAGTPDDFAYFETAGVDLARPEDRDQLRDLILDVGADFVVLDSLKRLSPSAAESSNDEMAVLMGGLQHVARATSSAILLLHHKSNKSGAQDVRGASAIIDQSDLVLHLTGDPAERMKLYRDAHKWRARDKPDVRYMRLVEADDLAWLEQTSAAPGARENLLDGILALGEAVLADEGWKRGRFADALGVDADNGTLTRALKAAVEEYGWSKVSGARYVPALVA